jgi:hypothetical protein
MTGCMPARQSGISAATLVLSGDAHDCDMPFLTIHLRSRQGQFSVSASDACAPFPFARGAAVMLAPPYMAKAHHAASTLAIALRPIGGIIHSVAMRRSLNMGGRSRA